MRKLLAWLGVATLRRPVTSSRAQRRATCSSRTSCSILDTSGSMDDDGDGSGPPSCGGTDNKLNHAKCAINNIANSYGDMVFALGRFRRR